MCLLFLKSTTLQFFNSTLCAEEESQFVSILCIVFVFAYIHCVHSFFYFLFKGLLAVAVFKSIRNFYICIICLAVGITYIVVFSLFLAIVLFLFSFSFFVKLASDFIVREYSDQHLFRSHLSFISFYIHWVLSKSPSKIRRNKPSLHKNKRCLVSFLLAFGQQ